MRHISIRKKAYPSSSSASFTSSAARARASLAIAAGQPFWSTDGNTIYYWTQGPPGSVITLMAARVQRGPPVAVTARDSVLAGAYFPGDSDLHPSCPRAPLHLRRRDIPCVVTSP